jgi:hypothetical protein
MTTINNVDRKEAQEKWKEEQIRKIREEERQEEVKDAKALAQWEKIHVPKKKEEPPPKPLRKGGNAAIIKKQVSNGQSTPQSGVRVKAKKNVQIVN